MDPRRITRYTDKIDHARERLAQVAEWLPDAATDARSRLAVFKAFQEATEAVSDLAAMILVDDGHAVKDDYRNLDLVRPSLGLTDEDALALAHATGLRNRLVHEYEKLDDERALAGLATHAPAVERFLGTVDAWLRSKA